VTSDRESSPSTAGVMMNMSFRDSSRSSSSSSRLASMLRFLTSHSLILDHMTGTSNQPPGSIVFPLFRGDTRGCRSTSRFFTESSGQTRGRVHAKSNRISQKRSTHMAQSARGQAEGDNGVEAAVHHLCCRRLDLFRAQDGLHDRRSLEQGGDYW
jgi:hypothetical protein